MRKWQTSITLAAVAIAVGGYLYVTPTPVRKDVVVGPNRVAPNAKDDGNGEASEVSEPLVVMGSVFPEVDLRGEFGTELEVIPRVLLEPGVHQPPRPDSEPGKVLRMPYADEQEGFNLPRTVTQMIERDLPRLNLFDELEKANPAEESEPMDKNPMRIHPLSDVPYHQQQCPIHGGCPAPYRPVPRN